MHYKIKRMIAVLLVAVCSISFIACSKQDQTIERVEVMFTSRDYKSSYNESESTIISLDDDKSTSKSNNVSISNNTVTIKKGGTYIISGELSNGSIIINAKNEKVQLVLNSVSITNSESAPITVSNANKVFITLADESNNKLYNTASSDESNLCAGIYSKSDITFNGNGNLSIESSTGDGIKVKKDVKFTSGSYNITAANHAIKAKNSIRITGASLNLTASEDGLHSEKNNSTDASKGFIYICGGTINICAGDDGMHAGRTVTIAGGKINITKSNEGIEGQTIAISGGTVDVNSSDDGLNASSGGGGNTFEEDKSCHITISGGKLHINANGDGIDSNGTLTVNGGEIYVDGPTSGGDGPLDFTGTGQISGGTIIAVGSSSMAQNFTYSSKQGSILANISFNKNETVTVKDNDGNQILQYTPAKSGECILISSKDITAGKTYTISTSSNSVTINLENNIYTEKSQNSPNGQRT